MDSLVRGLAAGLSVALLTSACEDAHSLTTEQAERAGRELSLDRGAATGLNLYFDVSGSMRGFALAATENERGAFDAFGSILIAARSLPAVVSTGPRAETPDTGSNGTSSSSTPTAAVTARSFGSVLDDPISPDQLYSWALGSQTPATRSRESLTGSADCSRPGAWKGAKDLRDRLDAFYADRSTCLDRVFQDIIDNGAGKLNVVITDAEQTAPLGDRACPNSQNLGTIQAYLNQWTEAGNFAALVAAKVPYQPWQSAGTNFCACSERLLFAYILAPSASVVDRTFKHFAEYWKASGAELAYVPLIPRPAVSYRLRVATETSNANPSAIFSTQMTDADLEPIEVGQLPRIWLKLNNDEAVVAFQIESSGFPTADSDSRTNIDWSKANLEWSAPVALSAEGTPVSGATAGAPFSLVQLAPQKEEGAGPPLEGQSVRTARYLGASIEPGTSSPVKLPTLRLRIRRNPSASGPKCQWFMLDVIAPVQEQTKYAVDSLSVFSSNGCVNWNSVAEQAKFLFKRGSLMRVLIHVDG